MAAGFNRILCIFNLTIMKRIPTLLMAVIVLATACKKKKTDEQSGWPDGTGDYAPYTPGSSFTYEVTGTLPPLTDSFTYRVTKDTTIEGQPYKKLESDKPALAGTFFCNYRDGVRTEITYNTTVNGIGIPVIKQTVLKANEAVNAQWQELLNVTIPGIPIPIPITFTYKLIQKGFTKNVLGKDYTNCIQARQTASIPANPLIPPTIPTSVTIENTFGSGQGLVQRDAANTTIKLKRYNVVR